MTMLFRDRFFQQHETGRHPERPERIQAIDDRLRECGLIDCCTLGDYEPLTDIDVLRVHDHWQFQLVKQLAEQGGGAVDADTQISPDSFKVTMAAAGACCSAVDQVLADKDKNALCLVRPPGHHANQMESMGFCLFNNIALAADHARRNHGLNRILIVDFDVHHGNGTQDIFYEDGQVTFFSIHRYGSGFYPGTGAANETGIGAGLGHNFNETIAFGTSRAEILARFRSALSKAAKKSKPELVLLSAGFDAHAQDPIGSLGLDTEDFVPLTQEVINIADVHAGGKLVCCLEGGYNLQALAESVQAHLETLLSNSSN